MLRLDITNRIRYRVIEEALAYIECTVQNYFSLGDLGETETLCDHTLIYAVVERGDVLESNGITAIQHRKSGSYY